MPGALVAIGLNGPRISTGASGFMSQVSNWLGAPRLKIMMHERLSCGLARPSRPGPQGPSTRGSENPMAPSVPTCRKSRRVTPSQVCAVPRPMRLSMAASPEVWRGKERGLAPSTLLPSSETSQAARCLSPFFHIVCGRCRLETASRRIAEPSEIFSRTRTTEAKAGAVLTSDANTCLGKHQALRSIGVLMLSHNAESAIIFPEIANQYHATEPTNSSARVAIEFAYVLC